MLERGVSGVGIDQLAFDMDFEAVTISTLKGVIMKLMKEGFPTELSQGRYAATSSLKATGKTYEITVEKIYPGTAVVMVDDKWKARLVLADYNGRRNFIKKNSRFRASAQLYRVEGTLCIRVNEVTEIL